EARGAVVGGELEVVDLLQHGLLAGPVLVVLVRREGRPVAARGEHFDSDQLVALEDPGRAEVVDLAGAVAGAPQLHGHVGGGPVAGGQPAGAAGAGEREPSAAGAGDPRPGVARDVGEVGDTVEHAGAAGEFEGLVAEVVVGGDRAAAAQRQDDPLAVAGVEGVAAAGRQVQHAQTGVSPAGALRADVDQVGAGRGAARGEVMRHGSLSSHNRPTAVSTADSTVPEAGYSSERPTTIPCTDGSRRALPHRSYAASWSPTSPPSRTTGRVEVCRTSAMSSASSVTGSFSQV